MTVLQALCGYYDRLAATGAAPRVGYSVENNSFAIVLASDGKVVDVRDIRDNSRKIPRSSQHRSRSHRSGHRGSNQSFYGTILPTFLV